MSTDLPHAPDEGPEHAARRAEEILAKAAIPVYPRGDLEIQILETLRLYYPMPITSIQLATLGTIARPTRSYYQHIPQGEGGIDA